MSKGFVGYLKDPNKIHVLPYVIQLRRNTQEAEEAPLLRV